VLSFLKNYAQAYYTTRPKLFFPRFVAQNPDLAYLCVSRETEILIEGFPRCGNTFAVVAFQKAQKSPVKIAHHLHVSAQIRLAVHWRIPAIVLIRKPLDAVSSLILRHPEREIDRCLVEYNIFYRSILPLKGNYVISDFDETISDFGSVTARVNDLFNTSFACFKHTPENIEAVFKKIEYLNKQNENGSAFKLARPAREKEIPKGKVKDMLLSRKFKSLLEMASQTYHRLTYG